MEVVDQLQEQSGQFSWSPKIKISYLEGRGNSVICTEALGPNERIIHLPASSLLNVSTISAGLDGLSPHETLALELLRRRDEGGDAWVDSLPQQFDSMPVSWPEVQRKLLPPRYLKRVQEQLREISDFAVKCSVSVDDAQWAWKAVNTRCLYWHQGGMTLAPAIDYLNHTCRSDAPALLVKSTPQGISVFTQSSHDAGEELTFSYGPHENGFLLVEYGFVAQSNPWNFVDISDRLERLVTSHRMWLEKNGYWGDWTIDESGQASFRVEVALATLQAPNERLLNALIAGYDDGSRYSKKTQQLLKSMASELQTDYKRVSTLPAIPGELKVLYTELHTILSKV